MDTALIKIILGFLVSYLLGSLPTAYIFGYLSRGIDLRKHGSGNLGATNAFRVLGKTIGTTVLCIDILKGTLAVLLINFFFYQENDFVSKNLALCLAALASVAGHNWTVFLGFKGGKGVATSLGALIAFSILIPHFIWIVVAVMALWLAIFLSTGFVSLASVICSSALPLLSYLFSLPKEITVFMALLGIFSLIRHKNNIFRLLQRKENRFNTRSFLSSFVKK